MEAKSKPNSAVNFNPCESIKKCDASILQSRILNVVLGVFGASASVTGALAAKGIILLGAASGIVLAKVLIPVGVALLLAVTINMIVQCCRKKKDEKLEGATNRTGMTLKKIKFMIGN